MEETCKLRRGFFRCGASAIGWCVYCNRHFCESHGVLLGDGQDVCNRGNCVAKRDDLVVHLAYKSVVIQRNVSRVCGVEDCSEAIVAQCYRCRGYYCDRHLRPYEDIVNQEGTALRRTVRLCRHCIARRPIWSRK